MNFLLKIVEGPNKGAEIALVEGVAVTLGKDDGCDIVLADPTMPEAPLKFEASESGVTVDGSPVEPFAVMASGATAFAVGPADAPWGELKWPKEAKGSDREPEAEGREESAPSRGPAPAPEEPPSREETEPPARRRGCFFGCLVALLVAMLVFACLFWLYRHKAQDASLEGFFSSFVSRLSGTGQSDPDSPAKAASLSAVAEKYGLSLVETNGAARLFGNLGTRVERLRATAEAYESQPGVNLDISDDETFRAAADDALFTLTEGALKVAAATNRVLSIVGASPSPLALKKTLEALNADLAKLRNVDASGVVIGGLGAVGGSGTTEEALETGYFPSRAARLASRRKTTPVLPVCGILTTPYPCLVMRDGRRIMEGAAIGDSVIVEIEADSVTLTNSTGRFTWKP